MALLGVVLSGCSEGELADVATGQFADSNDRAGTAGNATWVASDNETAVFLRWTESPGGSLSGMMQVVGLDEGGMWSDSGAVSGVRSGSSVTLDVDLLLGLTLTGEIDGGRLLTLWWPARDGQIEPMPMRQGTVGDFNEQVAALEETAAEEAAWRQQVDLAQQAVSDAQQQVYSTRRALQSAIRDAEVAIGTAEAWLGSAEDILGSLQERVSAVHQRVATGPSDLIQSDIELAVDTWEILGAGLQALDAAAGDAEERLRSLDGAVAFLEEAMRWRVEVDEQHFEVLVPQTFPDEEQLIAQAETLRREAQATLSRIRRTAADMESAGDVLLQEARSLLS